MPEQLDENAILSQAIRDLNPQVPVRSWQRDGRVLILHLANGRQIDYDWQSGETLAGDEAGPTRLADMLKDELVKLAQLADIPGRSSMTKAELVQALEEAHDA